MDGEVLTQEWHYQPHTDELTCVTDQPTQNLILERNNELRKNEGVINDLGKGSGSTWGRQVASIPTIMFHEAIKDGFDLFNKDADFASKEMFRFLQSEKGKTCLIRSKI